MGWDWGIILGVASLAFGVIFGVSIFQMIGGAPKLRVDYDTHQRGNNKILICTVQNEPVANRFLRFLRVQRMPVELSASYMVSDPITKTQTEIIRAAFMLDGGYAYTLSLLPPRSIGFVVANHNAYGTVQDQRRGSEFPLGPGTFLAQIIITASDRTIKAEREFVIGVDRDKTKWVD